jgi:multidrug efflux pump subunit AcrB
LEVFVRQPRALASQKYSDQPAAIGLLQLIGVVVNNGIVMLEQ